ncbi:hypothetical protein BrE312_3565 [Brenneria sp. EniD312]|nr:hypothetical protein BrE312_3565 [Brenneria sp. EniD312]
MAQTLTRIYPRFTIPSRFCECFTESFEEVPA